MLMTQFTGMTPVTDPRIPGTSRRLPIAIA
ncbi:hypothetical protein IWX81_002515 [Salinibacterium sp. CAN_S4]